MTRIHTLHRWSCAAILLPAATLCIAGTATTEPAIAYHGCFAELPPGSVQPRGWIAAWLRRQAGGLTGHPENLAYPYDTCRFGGTIPPPAVAHGEAWWPYEQAGYWIDAAVRLDQLVDHPALRTLLDTDLAYLLEHSGPAKLGESTWGWPNAVVGRALMAWHSATGDAHTLAVLAESLEGAAQRSGRDAFLFEQDLYVYGMTGDSRRLETARRAFAQLFVEDPRSFSHVDKLRGPAPLKEHGVTAAEQLKLLPLLFCHTGEAGLLELAELAYAKVEAHSLMPDGGLVSSEHLGAAAFDSLHETCDLTDWSWSIGHLLLAGGRAHWADLIERTTFNALPGAATKDFRQLQYFSAANQVLASSTACPRIAPTRLSYRASHDTECCSGNISRAMPNYVGRMWLRSGDGLAAALYGPSTVSAELAGQRVTLIEETDYPFRETITFRVGLEQPAAFTLALRIPEWCEGATVAVGGEPLNLTCVPGTFFTLRREFHDGDTVVLHLPQRPTIETWFGGQASVVRRGPLVFALPIEERRIESRDEPAELRSILKGNNVQGFPAVEFFPAGEWRYGLGSTPASEPPALTVVESPMPDNPFVAATAPVRLRVALRPLTQWLPDWRALAQPRPCDIRHAPRNPTRLPTPSELTAPPGPAQLLDLVPYGATHLRLTTFPALPAAPTPADHPPP